METNLLSSSRGTMVGMHCIGLDNSPNYPRCSDIPEEPEHVTFYKVGNGLGGI